ncbi:cyclic nucleotide-gated cation channel beta-1-like [Schistocerca gregaria]|uniref:cyclic nucleotide-gated cation channel beta-1-like n=1 Tax=Schistocerca gregaria TaxID=7010 RepID=UPI00211E3F59|nr:cyclic nucleotide-gated cation channel beta-1-like [Schistocerca gregaria]
MEEGEEVEEGEEEVEEGGEEVEEGGEEVEEGGEEVEEGGEEVEEGGEEVEEGGEEVEEGREEVEEGGEGVEEGGELGREEGEGENDLEIAWNVLEMARLIYSQSEGKKMELSEVHILLGEIALEEEKLDLAQSEIEKALELRLGLGDRRALAHAHFMLALVLEWKQDDQAVIDALERSRSLLYEEMKSVDEERVEEIKQTIEQIENKIQAVKDTFSPAPEDEEEYRSKSVSTSISEQVRELMSSSPAVATSSVKQPVQQLVARKRLGPREGSPEAKKPKCESSEAEKPRCEN